jgi:hypothetical protein
MYKIRSHFGGYLNVFPFKITAFNNEWLQIKVSSMIKYNTKKI